MSVYARPNCITCFSTSTSPFLLLPSLRFAFLPLRLPSISSFIELQWLLSRRQAGVCFCPISFFFTKWVSKGVKLCDEKQNSSSILIQIMSSYFKCLGGNIEKKKAARESLTNSISDSSGYFISITEPNQSSKGLLVSFS